MNAIILALFAWTSTAGINQAGTDFVVGLPAVIFSAASILVAGFSYFIAKQKVASSSALIAYALLVGSIGVVTLETGQYNSPFVALWMVSALFSGLFGVPVTGFLVTGLGAYTIWAISTTQLGGSRVLGILLVGLLPLLTSFVLWHGKSTSDKSKEKAYYDLENELTQVSNKAEVVIAAIRDGVIAINNKEEIELINAAAQRMVGWRDQDALHLNYKSVLQLLSKDGHELDKAKDPVYAVLNTNQPQRRNDIQIVNSSGKKVFLEVIVSPIGRLGSGAIIVFRDITKEQAEERAQAEFISTASHEMRTPVASIEGYLGLAMNPATAQIDDKAREFITKAHASAQHLGRLFQDLLDVTRADDGRLSNNPKVIDLVVFINGVIEELNAKAKEKNLRLFFKPATDNTAGSSRTVEPVFYVNLDADHLHEVVANLIENAIKYTLAGEVVVDIKGDEERVTVSISDSGIGIPVEDIPHLFQKFYRVDNSDTREIGGTGLGLYLCRRLVETMGGRIWVESEYKKGSKFSIELPRISHTEATQLIELATKQGISDTSQIGGITIPSAATDNDGAESDEGMTLAEKTQALNTPIIADHRKTVPQPAPKPAAPIVVAPVAQPAPASAPKPAPTAAPTPKPTLPVTPAAPNPVAVVSPTAAASAPIKQPISAPKVVVVATQPAPAPAQPTAAVPIQPVKQAAQPVVTNPAAADPRAAQLTVPKR